GWFSRGPPYSTPKAMRRPLKLSSAWPSCSTQRGTSSDILRCESHVRFTPKSGLIYQFAEPTAKLHIKNVFNVVGSLTHERLKLPFQQIPFTTIVRNRRAGRVTALASMLNLSARLFAILTSALISVVRKEHSVHHGQYLQASARRREPALLRVICDR